MLVSWGDMFVCPFMRQLLGLLISLTLFIVICGCLLSLASLVLNIIWSFLMIALTTYGLFLFALSLTLSARSPTSSPTPPLNLAPASRPFSAIMGKSSIIQVPTLSFSLRASIFSCLAHILRLKTVKPNILFAP